MKVLVTGASGFVGTALCEALARGGFAVRAALRDGSRGGALAAPVERVVVGTIDPDTDWSAALAGADAIVHAAARAHVMNESANEALSAYRALNVQATERLAAQALAARVRRLIYLSSVKVNGEATRDKPFTEADRPRPEDAYGVSKWEAEQALWRIAAGSAMEVAILRPPLLYGPGVKGNFLGLMRAIDRGVPLPLASIRNRRSLLFVGNLVDAIVRCLEHPAAAGKTYLVADGEDVSTPELARRVGHALGKPARLLAFAPALLKIAGAALGKSAAVTRLLGSLQVDSGRIRRELGWRPRTSMTQGLAETARWYQGLMRDG